MKVSGGLNKILDSKATGIAVFALSGAAKLVSDYNEAPDNNKNFVLLRDSLILGGSALGVGAYELASKNVRNSKTINNGIRFLKIKSLQKLNHSETYRQKIKPHCQKFHKTGKFCIEQLKTVTRDCLDNTLMVASGILGAVGADYGITCSHLEENKRLRKLHGNSSKIGTLYNYEDKFINSWENSKINRNFENAVGTEVKNNVYSQITNLPAMRIFNKTMVGMQGFEVIEEKTFKQRMKHATQCLVTNSLIPLFFLSTSSSLTKKMNSTLRLPIIFTSLVAGTMYTNKAIESAKNKPRNNN